MEQQPDHIRFDPERTLGIEILSFPGVEIEQTIGSKHSFNTVGTLDLLYFADYNRFILSLHHWNFPLFKELPIIKSSEGFVDPIIYILPIDDGFYTLKFTQVFHVEAIENLETIFKHNSSFISGTDAHALMNGGYDYEPLPRASLYGTQEPDPNRAGLSNTPSKEGSASKLRKRDIIKREVIRAADTIVTGIQKKKRDNVNMDILRDYEDLIRTSEDLAPTQYLYRKDVEKMILNATELIRRIEGDNELGDVYPVEHRGFLNALRSSAIEVRDRLYFRLAHLRETATAGGRSTQDGSQPRTSFGEKLVNIVPAIGKCYHPGHDYADHEYEVHLPSYLVNREELHQAIHTGEVHHQQSLLNKLKEKIPPMPHCGRSDMTTDRESTLTIMDRIDHVIHHPRASGEQTFDYNPAGPGLVQRVKAKIPEMVLKVRENFDNNRTSDDQAPPGIREKLKVDLEALKIQATEYAHLARENETVVRAVNKMKYSVPEQIHNIRESFQNNHLEGQEHPTLGEKVVDNLKGFKHQVKEYAHLIAENERVGHMVDKVKAGLHDIRDQLDSRKNADLSIYDVPVDPMLRADSISCMEDFQMQSVEIQPLHETNHQAPLSERITEIFIGQLQSGNLEERPHRGAHQEHEPLDFVCTIPGHNHHHHELQEQQVEIQEEPNQEVLLPQEFHEGVLNDQPVTMLDERLTQSEPAPDVHDQSRPDLLTEEMAGMRDLQNEQVIVTGENNINVLENVEEAPVYQEKEAVMYEPEIIQPVEQLEAVESQRRRVHIFDDKPIVGTNAVVRSHRTPKKIFDNVQRAVRNSQEFESMTHHG